MEKRIKGKNTTTRRQNRAQLFRLESSNTYYNLVFCLPITVAGCCSGDGVDESLLTASLLKNSTLAISVATQCGISGIAHIMINRIPSMMCSSATISRIVCVADISGNIRCTCPLNPIRAQFTRIATKPIASIAF